MKQIFFGLVLVGAAFSITHSNNLSISNVGLAAKNISAGINNPANYVFLKLDLQWENSWRTGAEPGNWDAAWIFMKYRIDSGPWKHATLHTTGHVPSAGSSITPAPDGKGVFIYRNAPGTGAVEFTGIKLRWNYGADNVEDNSRVTVQVFGVEMVYVSTDSFYLGSSGQEENTFTDGEWEAGDNTTPFIIKSENAFMIAYTPGNLWIDTVRVDEKSEIGPEGILPAAYPKGYQAFYCMKYPISQEQYTGFLNSLTYDQQAARSAVAPNSSVGTAAMTPFSYIDRNGIKIKVPGTASSLPAVYGCDLNENGVFGENDDGQNISCNWLTWADGTAYCDWAAIRPMTELEFEKACRGPLEFFQYERPYGNMVVAHSIGILNDGSPVESAVPDDGFWNGEINGATNINAGGVQHGLLDHPLRVGIYATDTSNRVSAGATYYGILDMAGDLWERVVTIGNLTGRAYTGTHGDGVLDNTGNAAGNSDWPGIDAVGAGFRGGAFNYDSDFARTSDRDWASRVNPERYEDSHIIFYEGNFYQLGLRGTFGFRGIRTAP